MPSINAHTIFHAIIGDPVRHSLSPAMHNAAFAALGMNRVYLAMPAAAPVPAVWGLAALGCGGASVTVPHKEAVMAALTRLDPTARAIGAVNTLVFDGKGGVTGHNTDWIGAVRALEGVMELAGTRVLVLGAGGSARAVGFGLRRAGAEPVIANRGQARGAALARDLDCGFIPLEEADQVRADALVNTTSVGMTPHQDLSPFPAAALGGFKVVMDIVYAPLETRLLAEAREAGCAVVDGLAMLLHQGAAQFELWTGEQAPLEVMDEALRRALGARQG